MKIDLPIGLELDLSDIEGFLAWVAVMFGFALALAGIYELRRDRDNPVEDALRDRHFGGV